MHLIKVVYRIMVSLGYNPKITIKGIKGLPQFWRDFLYFRKQAKMGTDKFVFGPIFPCFLDRVGESGMARGVYFHQDLLVARKIFRNNPERHIDVGSRVDGFIAHVASFREIEVIDIRETTSPVENIKFRKANLISGIDPELRESCDSLSCLHALEHFGLGRYGDPIQYDGHLIGLRNLTRILRKGGRLYISLPIGPQRVEFNAHRIFSLKYLLGIFNNDFIIENFSYVDDFILNEESIKSNCGCIYGCGIFEMVKK
jgi:hypothetical protein